MSRRVTREQSARSAYSVAVAQAEDPLVLAIDVGSSSVRAMLFDGRARAVERAAARQPYTLHTTAEGASEIPADELLERIWSCIDEVLRRAGPPARRVAAVAGSTFATNVLGLDGAGRPLTPLYAYADTRATADAAALRQRLDEEAIHQRTGCYLHTSYLPARFAWLARTQPETFSRAERWLSIAEYVERCLFDGGRAGYSLASWSGLLNRHDLTWDKALLAELPVAPEQLSPLAAQHEPARGLRPPFAERWPILRDVPWFPFAGDGAAANLGSGCEGAERVALTVGTTSALRVVLPASPEIPPGLWCYRVDARRSLLGGALSEGGNLFAWLEELLALDGNPARREAALAALAPDAHRLTVLPFISGERSPGWSGSARATIHGLTQATTPLEILRAGMEAVAFRIYWVAERLRPHLPEGFRIVASGGALLQSPAWQQILADVLNHPLAVSAARESSARGAAILALEALGAAPENGPLVAAVVRPDAAAHAAYREAMARQETLYQRLVPDKAKSIS